jgi:hypothetical protein
MDAHTIRTIARTPIFVLSLAIVFAGCNSKTPADDADLNSQVQIRLASDQTIGPESIQSSVSNGVVTLSGTVINAAGRTIAVGDVAQVPGVKKVVNNIALPAPPPPPVAPPAPKQPAQAPTEVQDTSTS